MTALRQTISVDDIKSALLDRIEEVVAVYAPAATGSYRDGHHYFTLNPGRYDRSVGSFVVNMTGPLAGQWHDFSGGSHGDLIDLMGLQLGLNAKEAFAEARRFLGLQHESPEDRRAREARAAQAEARRKRQEAEDKAKREKYRLSAQALWLSAQEKIAGTPVAAYLAGRGINLAALGYQPRAIRFHPECYYRFKGTDPDTGEVLDVQSKLPAMVTAISRGSVHVATHRTYLARRADGTWGKADLPSSKKVLGDFKGGSIRLSNGLGPKGGRGCPMSACPPATRVYVTEGIESGLSVCMALPAARVLAGVSLSNLASVELPDNVAELVIVADADEHKDARKELQRAIDTHARRRAVRLWQSATPGADANDELQRRLRAEGGA